MNGARMWFRIFLPHYRLILDALVAAVLLTVLRLTAAFFIQALVDSVFVHGHNPALTWLGLGALLVTLARAGSFHLRSCLLAHLSRRIKAETVPGYHRRPLGLPFAFAHAAGVMLQGFCAMAHCRGGL
jgi:ABC-type bacteriocin/lantibiotic exporter with double-glycine peptidase domain